MKLLNIFKGKRRRAIVREYRKKRREQLRLYRRHMEIHKYISGEGCYFRYDRDGKLWREYNETWLKVVRLGEELYSLTCEFGKYNNPAII